MLTKAPVFREVEGIDSLDNAVVKRKQIQSTGLGEGVAVAHESQTVGGIVVALGISRQGIPFGADDGEPVRFLFVVANPPDMQLEYLLALSVLVRVIRDERFRDELLARDDSADIEARLSRAFRTSMIKRGFPFS